MPSDVQKVLDYYSQNEIFEAFSLLDSLRYANQDSCDQFGYVIMKTDRYWTQGKSRKAFRYLERKEPIINICSEEDRYKFKLQKAYFSSKVNNINTTAALLDDVEKMAYSISDTSSFGIKRLHLKAKIAKHFGRIGECRRYISDAINIQLFRKKLTHPESSGFFRTLAYSYLEEGQFEKAREYFRMERQIYRVHIESFPQLLGVMFYNEANTHYEQLEFQEAISDYDSTLYYWSIDPPSKVYLRYANEALGDLYYDIGNIKMASNYWTIASEIKPPKSNDKADKLPDPNTLSQESNFTQLSIAYNDALAFRKSIYGDNHALTGECLTFVGRLNEIQNQNEKALATYNEALEILIPGFNFRKGNTRLDSLDKIDRYGFDAFLGMTRIYYKNYTSEGNKSFLDSASRISQYAFQALDKVKISYEDSHTALFWSDFTYPMTELSLKIHHTYNTISTSNQNSKLAFLNSEASKSYLLRSNMHKDKVLRKGKLPESVKEKEQKITGALHRIKGSIRMEEKRCGDAQQAKIKIWQNELVKVQQEYSAFLSELSLTHPKQFKRLYETSSIDSDQLLQSMKKKQMTFISFFYGAKNIYRFHAHADEIWMKEIPISETFEQEFKKLKNQISNYQNSPQLTSSASKLYQILLGDLSISEGLSITIIPDGPLYNLPWEALVINEDETQKPVYLIEKHPISYVQSANLLAEYLATPPKTCNYFLSILPEYKTPLEYSSNDILPKNNKLKIHTLSNTDVTKSQIINRAAHADIIHFAGHSSINKENEMMSQLHLGKYEKSPLLSHEIFDMNLDAALVVLSSCHSGSGKYLRGEGIMNFSQAFQQAGSESVIMSLWNVDDKSTSDLFSKFYKPIENGQSKSGALRQAKLDFINSGDPLISHPFFWASFVLYGDDDPVVVSSFKRSHLFYVLGFGLLVFIGLMVFKKRNGAD